MRQCGGMLFVVCVLTARYFDQWLEPDSNVADHRLACTLSVLSSAVLRSADDGLQSGEQLVESLSHQLLTPVLRSVQHSQQRLTAFDAACTARTTNSRRVVWRHLLERTG